MAATSKRQYLKYAGTALAALSMGVGGKLAADGALQSNVENTREVSPAANPGGQAPAASPGGSSAPETPAASPGPAAAPADPAVGADEAADPYLGPAGSGYLLDYERDDNGDVEFEWGGLMFETHNGDLDVEFEVNDYGIYIEFETKDGGESVELTAVADGDYIDFEVDHLYDVEFEAASDLGTKFEDDGHEVEYRGRLVDFEWDPESLELDLKIAGARLEWSAKDQSTRELEYRGIEVQIEWEGLGYHSDGDFEARRL
ncbi:hypothetical protein [Haloarchaeobius sp. DYHT-AS-18]|uniref:hypothetical protein n=1 Tax=Haloarchaeobius sp. DYHT-AS-18 TaxID=3446117 RepID=UPI003EC1056D